MKIGIPRALLYYWYGPYWEEFWSSAGFEVITSPETNHQIMMAGVEVALHELCLPVKIFLGHVLLLASKVDFIMIPHLIKVESDAYICPKFMGLPDLVSHAMPAIKDKLIIVKQGPKQVDLTNCLVNAALKLGISKKNLKNLPSFDGKKPDFHYPDIIRKQNQFMSNNLSIGLLGHPYCLYDSCLNLNLFQSLLKLNIQIYTPEMIPSDFKGIGSGKLNKKLFWTTGKIQFDALEWMLTKEDPPIDGFIEIAPFACGPEAIVSDMLERRIKAANKPFLKMYFEEHSGEAGMVTRLEAFLDLIRYHSTAC